MKSYTFTLPKNTKSAKTYKESLMDRVINAYPWMTVESKSDYPSCSYGIEYAGAGDIIILDGCRRNALIVRLSVGEIM